MGLVLGAGEAVSTGCCGLFGAAPKLTPVAPAAAPASPKIAPNVVVRAVYDP